MGINTKDKELDMNDDITWLWIILVILIAISFGFPLIIDYVIIPSDTVSNISNDQWIQFLSSYSGGIIGGIATLIAIMFSIRHTTKIQNQSRKDILALHEDNKQLLKDIQKENKSLVLKSNRESIKPVLSHYGKKGRSIPGGRKQLVLDLVYKNIGQGIPFNSEVRHISGNGAPIKVISSTISDTGDSFQVRLILDNETVPNKDFYLTIEFCFYDLLENNYNQIFCYDYYINEVNSQFLKEKKKYLPELGPREM